MADLTPNDLSHLSDEAFWALCPQGEHAPGPEPLSPAAQAVSNAAKSSLDWEAGYLPNAVAAAALRAASAAGRGGGGMSQPLSPVEELQERYRSAADEYPDPDGLAAALRAVADQVVPEPPTWEIGVLSAADREVEIRREILAIADELENHQ